MHILYYGPCNCSKSILRHLIFLHKPACLFAPLELSGNLFLRENSQRKWIFYRLRRFLRFIQEPACKKAPNNQAQSYFLCSSCHFLQEC